MTRAEKNRAIAEQCGWKTEQWEDGADFCVRDPSDRFKGDYPHYFTNRAACDDARRVVEDRGLAREYTDFLRHYIGAEGRAWESFWAVHIAPPEAIAEALYRTFEGVKDA